MVKIYLWNIQNCVEMAITVAKTIHNFDEAGLSKPLSSKIIPPNMKCAFVCSMTGQDSRITYIFEVMALCSGEVMAPCWSDDSWLRWTSMGGSHVSIVQTKTPDTLKQIEMWNQYFQSTLILHCKRKIVASQPKTYQYKSKTIGTFKEKENKRNNDVLIIVFCSTLKI